MTKEVCLDKIRKLRDPAWSTVMKRAEAILDSGFVDYWGFDDNTDLLPNLILEVCLHYTSKQYHPSNLTKDEKETLRNCFDL